MKMLSYFSLVFSTLLCLQCEARPKVAEICDDFCPRIYDPKCGSDDKTYDNICELKLASCQAGVAVTVKYDGKCGEPLGCPTNCNDTDGTPVCGSDGKMRPNHCVMKHHFCQSRGNITMVKKGPCDCPPDAPPVFCPIDSCSAKQCPRVPSALCLVNNCGGCNLQFYSNNRKLRFCVKYCMLNVGRINLANPLTGKGVRHGCVVSPRLFTLCKEKMAKYSVATDCYPCPTIRPTRSKKKCRDPCKFAYCPLFPLASCRQDKADPCKTEFFFPDVNETLIPAGDCGEDCSNDCTREYFPVCATNGVTYESRCILNYHKCKSGGKFHYLRDGPCTA